MRVAELVEQRLRVVEADQHRLAGLALGEVVVVRREHDVVAEQARAAAVGRHPRARALSLAREIVEVEQADDLAAGLIGDLERADVRVEDRDRAGVLLEAVARRAGPADQNMPSTMLSSSKYGLISSWLRSYFCLRTFSW